MTNEKILNRFLGIMGWLEKARSAIIRDRLVVATRHIDEAELWANEFCSDLRKKISKEKLRVEKKK